MEVRLLEDWLAKKNNVIYLLAYFGVIIDNPSGLMTVSLFESQIQK